MLAELAWWGKCSAMASLAKWCDFSYAWKDIIEILRSWNYAAPPAPSNGKVQVLARKMPEAAYKIEQPKNNVITPDTSVNSSTFYGGMHTFIDFKIPQTIGQIQSATLRLTVNNTHTAAVDAVPVPY